MNVRTFSLFTCILLPAVACLAQGFFLPSNPGALTRIGFANGPLAETNIYAQMFAGAQSDSLIPVGLIDFHIGGIIFGPNAAVPGVPPLNYAYVQMVVWDSAVWGTSLASVPSDQLSRTDIVTVLVTDGFDFTVAPVFTQPAIVPIPEPSTWTLLALGAAGVWFARARRR